MVAVEQTIITVFMICFTVEQTFIAIFTLDHAIITVFTMSDVLIVEQAVINIIKTSFTLEHTVITIIMMSIKLEQAIVIIFVMYMNITVYHYYSMYDVEQVAMTVFVMFSPSKTLRVQYSMK